MRLPPPRLALRDRSAAIALVVPWLVLGVPAVAIALVAHLSRLPAAWVNGSLTFFGPLSGLGVAEMRGTVIVLIGVLSLAHAVGVAAASYVVQGSLLREPVTAWAGLRGAVSRVVPVVVAALVLSASVTAAFLSALPRPGWVTAALLAWCVVLVVWGTTIYQRALTRLPRRSFLGSTSLTRRVPLSGLSPVPSRSAAARALSVAAELLGLALVVTCLWLGTLATQPWAVIVSAALGAASAIAAQLLSVSVGSRRMLGRLTSGDAPAATLLLPTAWAPRLPRWLAAGRLLPVGAAILMPALLVGVFQANVVSLSVVGSTVGSVVQPGPETAEDAAAALQVVPLASGGRLTALTMPTGLATLDSGDRVQACAGADCSGWRAVAPGRMWALGSHPSGDLVAAQWITDTNTRSVSYGQPRLVIARTPADTLVSRLRDADAEDADGITDVLTPPEASRQIDSLIAADDPLASSDDALGISGAVVAVALSQGAEKPAVASLIRAEERSDAASGESDSSAILTVYRCQDVDCLDATATQATLPWRDGYDRPGLLSVAVAADGTAYVTVADVADAGTLLIVATPEGEPSVVTLDPAEGQGGEPFAQTADARVAVTGNNRALVVTNTAGSGAQIAYACGDVACTSITKTVYEHRAADGGPGVPGPVLLAVDDTGRAVFAVHSPEWNAEVLRSCDDDACTSAATRAITAPGVGGARTVALTLSERGHPQLHAVAGIPKSDTSQPHSTLVTWECSLARCGAR